VDECQEEQALPTESGNFFQSWFMVVAWGNGRRAGDWEFRSARRGKAQLFL